MRHLTLIWLMLVLLLSGCCDEEADEASSGQSGDESGMAGGINLDDAEVLAGIVQAALPGDALHGRLSEGEVLVYEVDLDVPHTGWVKQMHANGKLAGLAHYREGRLHGPAARWYRTGQRAQQTFYQHGKEHGVETWWYQDGVKWKETHFKDNREHGPETWWYKNGRKRSQTHYVDGQLQGPAASWHENGEEWYKIDYQDGHMVEPREL
ncbi:MAG: hypothetical protein ACPHVK_05320 [Akkermansiaceae bacterium]